MPILDQLIPLYLTACTVEGKTDRTVQSYAETLRQFRRAVDKLDLPVSIEAFGPAPSGRIGRLKPGPCRRWLPGRKTAPRTRESGRPSYFTRVWERSASPRPK